MKITVTVEVAGLVAKAARWEAGRALKVAGRALENAVRKYYLGRGGVFWPRVGKAWTPEVSASSAAVVAEGEWGRILQHKITGGVIAAANAKNLAIPANDEARKKGSPRNFESDFLRFVMFGKGGPKALVKAEPKKGGKGGKRKKGAGKVERKRPEVWYWLKASVTQKADPNALPPPGPLAEAVRKAVEDHAARGGGP